MVNWGIHTISLMIHLDMIVTVIILILLLCTTRWCVTVLLIPPHRPRLRLRPRRSELLVIIINPFGHLPTRRCLRRRLMIRSLKVRWNTIRTWY